MFFLAHGLLELMNSAFSLISAKVAKVRWRENEINAPPLPPPKATLVKRDRASTVF